MYKKMKKFTKITLLLFLFSSLLTSCLNNVKKDEEKSFLIPYIVKQGEQTDLYLTDLNNKTKIRLTNDAFLEADPSILPNGRIMFASKRTGTWQIYTVRQDGKDIRPITKDRYINNFRPSLTIDGNIIFVSDREKKTKIFLMDLDGGSLVNLTPDDFYYDYPAPLDDGTILYLTTQLNKWEIWKMNADGNSKKRITNIPVNPISLSAMPSYVKDSLLMSPLIDDSFAAKRKLEMNNLSSKAVYTARDRNGDLEIYRVNLDGSDQRNLTEMPGVDANPVVLRNGKIAFTSDRDGTFDVWIMEADGYNPFNLTKTRDYESTR